MLRELLSTWENWNSRTALVNTLLRGRGDAARGLTERAIDKLPEVHPLARCAPTANSSACSRAGSGGPYDARWRGHTWPQIADVLGVTIERARASYDEVVDRRERLLERDVDLYRDML